MAKSKWTQFYNIKQTNLGLPMFDAKTFVFNKLAQAGIADKAEAEWLIALTLGVKRANLALVGHVSQKQWQQLQAVAQKRIKRIPLTKLFKSAEFYGLPLMVNKHVLSPRPETEELVAQALQHLQAFKAPSVLDLCTGSGAIACAIKHAAPQATVFASDICPKALRVARQNAKSLGLNITFVQSNMFDTLPTNKQYDIIVSNPPYIPLAEINGLEPEVKNHDPLLALVGGASGLVYYQQIAQSVSNYLSANGVLLLEIGYNQQAQVTQIFKTVFAQVTTLHDSFNQPRMVICKQKKEAL